MAKLIETNIVIKVSKLVKDTETASLPDLVETLEQMVGEIVNDPRAIIEVTEVED